MEQTILLVGNIVNIPSLSKSAKTHRFEYIENGFNAIERINQNLPLLIILATNLPDMDGFEFCKKLKENNSTKDIPVIFIEAANADATIKTKCYDAGGIDCIQLPLNEKELAAKLSYHSNTRQLQINLEEAQQQVLKERIAEKPKATDSTNQKMAESEARCQFALDGARQGVWDWDIETNKVFYSKSWKAMLGFSENEIGDSLTEWEKRVHPDDKKDVFEKIEAHLKGASGFYESEHRLLCKDGTYKWILDRGKQIPKTNIGISTRFIGTHNDISKRKKVEEILKKTMQELSDYKYALDQSSNISITDANGIIKYVNDNFCKTYGYSKEEVIGQNHKMLNSDKHPASFWTGFWKTIQKGEILKAEVKNKGKNGNFFWSDTTIVPFVDNTGSPYQYLAIRRDITEKRKLEKQLAQQQIYNQRLFTELAIQEQETERDSVSTELHENINQILAGAKIYLGLVLAKTTTPDEILQKSYEYLENAMGLINKLSYSLVGPSLKDFGLSKVVQHFIEDTIRTHKINIFLENKIAHPELLLEYNKMLMIVRVIQEQVENIIKHANAKTIHILLYSDNKNIYLNIEDDGDGCDTKKLTNGFGLVYIKNRVEFYAGKINVSAYPKKGFRLEISIPLQQKQVSH
jgi:PAS domain S-box-containing protein